MPKCAFKLWWPRLAGPCTGVLAAVAAGCATPHGYDPSVDVAVPVSLRAAAREPSAGAVRQASYQTPKDAPPPPKGAGPPKAELPAAAADKPRNLGLDDLVRLAVERNPRVAGATIAIDAAQGRYVQAGLYPNPEFAFRWDEIGDKTAVGNLGIMSPQLTQTIVTGRKLTIAQAVAAREVDQATLEMLSERFTVIGSVRSAFYDALALQQRLELLGELVRLAEQAVEQSKTLLAAQRAARLDVVQLEVELERFRAEARAAERELPAVYQRLTAAAGDPRLSVNRLIGPFEAPPAYDLDGVREAVLAAHPQARSARIGVERAQAAVRQAEVQPLPNLTVTGGYVRQFENRSHDAVFGISAPIPVWNRNQGNIRAAQADLGRAVQNVGRVENDLAERIALAFRTYAAARERAERYRTEIVPRAEETYKLSTEAFRGGQFEYLRVIQAQRAVAEARLELNRSLGEAWRAAGEISGLLLEEAWPVLPPAPRAPQPPAPKDAPPERR